MNATALPAKPRGLALMFGWRRVWTTFAISTFFGLMLGAHWTSGPLSALERTVLLGFITMTVFGVFEQWPRRLPRWVARWVLQVVAVAVAIPPSTAIVYWLSTPPGAPPFSDVKERM